MAAEKRLPVRFGLLTALVWLAVAGGVIFLLWQVIARLSASNLPASTATANQSQVNQTIAALVNTQNSQTAAAVTPVATASSTATLPKTATFAVATPKLSPTAGPATQTDVPEKLCDQVGAGNPLDVTIPDDSLIPAGQSFVKTWKLVNTGTCTWTNAYSASFFYGDRMGAPETVPLQGSVLPSESVEISVEMVAPQSAGTYQGNWKLMNPSGELFGIGPSGNQAFWVRIVVVASQATSTATPTISVTANPTQIPTSTVTPPGQVGGVLKPAPGDAIDLDTITLNSEDEDVLYLADESNFHWLNPTNGAMIGIFGSQAPSLSNCQSAVMSPAPVAVESLPIGTYLCYATSREHLGRMQLQAVDPNAFTLTLDLLTWAAP
jgi:hypothetical protein